MLKSNTKFSRATGSVSFGKGNICRAIDIKIGDVRLLLLSKAPYVTEDIKRDVGKRLEEYAKKLIGKKGKVILIDAHNTRFESAPKEELEGIRSTKSKYFKDYKKAIADALAKETNNSLKIGFASRRLFELIGKRKDIGNGYTSVCVVQNGHEKFCFVYFDANNMLPGFRKEIIEHIEEKFDMNAELCTTDTHAINLVSEDASNALGRYTKPNELIPVLDLLIGSAIGNLDYAYYAFASRSIDNFKVWGPNASELIKKTSIEIRHRVLRIVPFLIIAAFIIAAWIISFA
jgi:Predicted membrane protein